jgi:DNA processing protein
MWIPTHDPRLPEPLRQLSRPSVQGLTIAGDPAALWSGVRVGIVGSRTARSDSIAIARRIAHELAAAGVTIVSGLARGIDGIAHEAALDAGGRTIAVLASGLAHVYPARHRGLAVRIADTRPTEIGVSAGVGASPRGAIVTEYGAGSEPPFANRFPARNRIIAALSDYLIVVQAQPRSGSMSTAHAALDLGIPIGIGPVDPAAPAFQGALSLVRDGADMVVDGVSVARRLELHGVVAPGFAEAFEHGAYVDASGRVVIPDVDERAAARRERLLAHPIGCLLDIARTDEDIAELAGLGHREVRRLLLELESEGLATATPDGQWIDAALV